MVNKADLILVMESGHKKAIETADVTVRGKVFRLGETSDRDIVDPYRRSRAVFEDVLEDIDEGIADWVKQLTA